MTSFDAPPSTCHDTAAWAVLSFETRLLNKLSAQLSAFAPKTTREASQLSLELMEQWHVAGVKFVSYKAKTPNRNNIASLEAIGFRKIETLSTLKFEYERSIPDMKCRSIDFAAPEHAEQLYQIGSQCFTHDRFHADPHIPNNIADDLKGQWMQNTVNGRSDAVFLWIEDGKAVAANACMIKKDAAIIDLIGVLPEYQGQGIGRKLVEHAIFHYRTKCTHVLVGTQNTNAGALTMYQSLGFHTIESSQTYHLHMD